MTEVVRTTDLDVARDLLTRWYTSLRLSADGGLPLLHLSQAPLGRVRLDRLTVSMAISAEVDPLPEICVTRPLAGTVSISSDGADSTFGPGDLYIPAEPGMPHRSVAQGLDVEVAAIDPTLLAEVVQPDGGAAGRVELLDRRPVSPDAAAQWWRVYAFARGQADDPVTAASPLLTSAVARLVAATTLAAFPHNGRTDPTIEDRHDAHPATVRRAVAFIEANAAADVSAADIAAAAHVTIRAVQLGFRRHLGTTPMAYLRRVRLDGAHRELVAADPGVVTVTEVAARWGFADYRRFAAAYRAAYGRPPSHTLRH